MNDPSFSAHSVDDQKSEIVLIAKTFSKCVGDLVIHENPLGKLRLRALLFPGVRISFSLVAQRVLIRI